VINDWSSLLVHTSPDPPPHLGTTDSVDIHWTPSDVQLARNIESEGFSIASFGGGVTNSSTSFEFQHRQLAGQQYGLGLLHDGLQQHYDGREPCTFSLTGSFQGVVPQSQAFDSFVTGHANSSAATNSTIDPALLMRNMCGENVDHGLFVNEQQPLEMTTYGTFPALIPVAIPVATRIGLEIETGSFSCPHCHLVFRRRGDLERHAKSHDIADQRKCAFCDAMKRPSRCDKYKEHLVKGHKMADDIATAHARQWIQSV